MSKKIIYIMGNSRSGSTFLDLLLGSHPDALSIGELFKLAKSGWQNNELCSCGSHLQQCSFWSTVSERWKELSGLDESQYMALKDQFYRSWYLLKPSEFSKKKDFQTFIKAKQSFYQAIFEISGKNIIVDSSKNPIDAYFATLVPDTEVTLLHLVRDSRGVVWSMSKSFEQNLKKGVQHEIKATPIGQTIKSWLVSNLSCSYLGQVYPKDYIRLLYKDLMTKPQQVLDALSTKTGIDFTTCLADLEQGIEPGQRHVLAGNRLRMDSKVSLSPDFAWKEGLAGQQKAVISLLTLPLLVHYGLLRREPRAKRQPVQKGNLNLPTFSTNRSLANHEGSVSVSHLEIAQNPIFEFQDAGSAQTRSQKTDESKLN